MATAVRQRDRIDQALSAAPERPTIFARSTGTLPSAIAIIRVSGPRAARALEVMTCQPLPRPRYAVVRKLFDNAGALLDTALVLWMPGPSTATGEDLVELHLHGGRAVVAGVEAALASLEGLEPAEAGAFTRRAFENGRIDLSQVEGLADLLVAETARQRVAALAMSEGGLRRAVEGWQVRLLDLCARVEASIDHDDEDDVVSGPIDADAAALIFDMTAVLASPPAERLRDGVRVAVAGPPNAGKSSLINVLAGRDAAIVSPVAGTTRDIIEIPVIVGDLPMVLTDTAGLRSDSDDPVEQIGIGRARGAITRCDVLVWLGQDSPPVAPCVLTVSAKCDIDAPHPADHVVSVVTGEGITALRAAIIEAAAEQLPVVGSLSLSLSQRTLLIETIAALRHLAGQTDDLLHAEWLRLARQQLNRITGAAGTEEMLDRLFGRFCIGK